MRTRPARDAIQFTLDLDALDVKEDNAYNTKNFTVFDAGDYYLTILNANFDPVVDEIIKTFKVTE